MLDLVREPWMGSALCAQTDPELFYPAPGAAGGAGQARRVCRACPVQAECLAYALLHREEYGVWGGMSPSQRRLLPKPAREPRSRCIRGHVYGVDPIIDSRGMRRCAACQRQQRAETG